MNMVLDGEAPRSRSTDPVTSQEAGRAANLQGSQLRVLGMLEAYGPKAQFELENMIDEYSPSRVRSAVSELAHKNLVEVVGETTTKYGRLAQVWGVVEH